MNIFIHQENSVPQNKTENVTNLIKKKNIHKQETVHNTLLQFDDFLNPANKFY